MVRLILKKGTFPSRNFRWCTSELKLKMLKAYLDTLDSDVINCVGIRRSESRRRAKLSEFDYMEKLDLDVWRPIIKWTEEDVIGIHKKHGLSPNPLYLRNSERVGCWPCIMSRKAEIANIDRERIHVISTIEHYLTNKKGNPRNFFYYQNIEKTIDWSKTSRGGKQYKLFNTLPADQSCMKWGMCEK